MPPSDWSSRTDYPIEPPAGPSGASIACSSLMPRSRTGSRPGGKKGARRIPTDYLDWALSDFSGYIAADELYDGPFCVLSIVDNRTFKRLSYQVLDRDPTSKDIEAFFHRFHQALEARGLVLEGITTDGSSLVSRADRHGLRCGAASTLHLSCPQGSDQGGPLRRCQAPKG